MTQQDTIQVANENVNIILTGLLEAGAMTQAQMDEMMSDPKEREALKELAIYCAALGNQIVEATTA